jgi:hypothetical protein
MAAARKPKDSPEMAKFRRKVVSVLRAAHLYSTTGGGDDHAKALDALYRARNAVLDMRHKLQLDTHERDVGMLTSGRLVYNGAPLEQQQAEELESGELEERVKRAVAGARDAGELARQEIRNGELRKLDDERRAHRAWRIENGLEDPPRRF